MKDDELYQQILETAKVQNAIIDVLDEQIDAFRASVEPKLQEASNNGQPKELSELVAYAVLSHRGHGDAFPASIDSVLRRIVS